MVLNGKAILVKNGFGIVWLCQSVGYHLTADFKERLICCYYKQNWRTEIKSNNNYIWFYSFKCTFEAEFNTHYKQMVPEYNYLLGLD